MTNRQLTIVAAVHAAAAIALLLLFRAVRIDDLAAYIAAALASAVLGAVLHHRRIAVPATAGIKLAAGAAGAAAVLVLGTGIALLSPGHLQSPEAAVPIAAVGAILLPFAVFEETRKAIARRGTGGAEQ